MERDDIGAQMNDVHAPDPPVQEPPERRKKKKAPIKPPPERPHERPPIKEPPKPGKPPAEAPPPETPPPMGDPEPQTITGKESKRELVPRTDWTSSQTKAPQNEFAALTGFQGRDMKPNELLEGDDLPDFLRSC